MLSNKKNVLLYHTISPCFHHFSILKIAELFTKKEKQKKELCDHIPTIGLHESSV